MDLPSGSADAIPKDAVGDEFVRTMKIGSFPLQGPTRSPKLLSDLKIVSNKLEKCGYEVVNLKYENNGSFSITFKSADGGVPEIVPDSRNYDPEIEIQKVIRFLNASMFVEFPEGDNKVMVVTVVNLPAEIEEKDMVIAVENHKLVVELNAVPPILELYGRIKKFAEFPVGVTGSEISILLEDQTLTVTVALKKLQPEEKPKSIFSKIKGAWPACLAVGGKMAFDAIN